MCSDPIRHARTAVPGLRSRLTAMAPLFDCRAVHPGNRPLRAFFLCVCLSQSIWAVPSITSFTCSADPCTSGSTLSWVAAGTTDVQLVTTGTAVPVTASGSTTVAPSASRIYQLQARDTAWGLVTKEILVVAGSAALPVTPSANTISIDPATQAVIRTPVSAGLSDYDVYELTLANSGSYVNPDEDAPISVTFTAPSSTTYTIGGVYDGAGLWRVRFSPVESGTYTYSWTFGAPAGYARGTGSFTALSPTAKGWIRINPSNTTGFITADGAPFYPAGLEGHSTAPGKTRIIYPATRGLTAPSPVLAGWAAGYANAGFNLVRCNQGCDQNAIFSAFNTQASGRNSYSLAHVQNDDQMLFTYHQFGLHIVFNGDATPSRFPNGGYDVFANPIATMAYLKEKLYEISRFGPYVDLYELINESDPGNTQWLNTMGRFLHQHDPYGHLVDTYPPANTSLDVSEIDVLQPHIYLSSPPLTSPSLALPAQEAYYIGLVKKNWPGKPLFWGESGNAVGSPDTDPFFNQRHRIMLWTLFMNQVGIVQWNSYLGDGTKNGAALIYLGGIQRGQTLVWAQYARDFDGAAAPAAIAVAPSGNDTVAAFALASNHDVGAYLFHTNNNSTFVSGTVTVTVPQAGMRGYWLDPASGKTLAVFSPPPGVQTLPLPPGFAQDVALRLTANPAPAMAIAPTGLDWGAQGTAYSQPLTAAGGTGPYTWTVLSGSLPPGLSLDSSTGTISGSPTDTFWQSYLFTIQVSDAAGQSAAHTYSLTIRPAVDSFSITEQTGHPQSNYPVSLSRSHPDGELYFSASNPWSPQIGACTDASCTAISAWYSTAACVTEQWPDGFVKSAGYSFTIPTLPAGATMYFTFRQAQVPSGCSAPPPAAPVPRSGSGRRSPGGPQK